MSPIFFRVKDLTGPFLSFYDFFELLLPSTFMSSPFAFFLPLLSEGRKESEKAYLLWMNQPKTFLLFLKTISAKVLMTKACWVEFCPLFASTISTTPDFRMLSIQKDWMGWLSVELKDVFLCFMNLSETSNINWHEFLCRHFLKKLGLGIRLR